MDEIANTVQEVEQSITKLSKLLGTIAAEVERVMGKPLGELKVGEKIKIAKLICAAQQKLK